MKSIILNLFHRIIKRAKHKTVQSRRLTRKARDFFLIMAGAALVSWVALGFSRLVDLATQLNFTWTSRHPLSALFVIPCGFMLLVWLTRRLAPYTAGSGIPQVMAALYEPHPSKKRILIRLVPTLLKIPFTFFGLVLGASIGREGPTVQLGAAVMYSWGRICEKYKLTRKRFKKNDLLAMGAAGGMAAAFNAPLAGIIFAIEELSRIAYLKWERNILFGILASGFILIAIEGNNPHFPVFYGNARAEDIFFCTIICALACGILGGLFSKLLTKGFSYFCPQPIKKLVLAHPLWTAGLLGLAVAIIGIYFKGATYGVGYSLSANALLEKAHYIPGLLTGKFLASILSYWAGLPGGIFSPSLSIGALLGVALHSLPLYINIDSDTMVLFCMAAFLAAVTQSPLTASVVVMEMTLSISMLFWLLICSIIATFVARQFSPRSFYLTSAIKYVALLNNLPMSDKKSTKQEN
ncbi:MAG: chloride channel protein [Neisseriaceae bacterium]